MSNGGFAAGTFAEMVGGTASVRLHAKVPVGADLVASGGGSRAEVTHRGARVATIEARPAFSVEPPVIPTMEEALDARRRHPMLGVRHPLSSCVVCGPERLDGLRVTPGPLASDREVLASPFIPSEQYAVDRIVRPAAVWGALDCPSYPAGALRDRRFCLLGMLEAHQVRPLHAQERLVVVGWTTATGGRSIRTASAILDGDGAVVASARAVWVALRHQRLIRVISRLGRG